MSHHHEHGDSAGHAHQDPHEDPAQFWEQKYSAAEAVWSGRVNRSLADVAADWAPGRSLDLGCGEGGDVLWLAAHGWQSTGIDLSPTAVARAEAAAAAQGLENARFIAADLSEWAAAPAAIDGAAEPFDMVTASFFQSPVALAREQILRAAAARVAIGGHIVVVSHAAPPAWAPDHPGEFPSPAEELETLSLDSAEWQIEASELRSREVTLPEGGAATLDDTVVVARRIA